VEERITKINIYPATVEDIEWIAKTEAKLFEGVDIIPEEILKEWYYANPTGSYVLKTQRMKQVGHIDILPIRPRVLDLFVEGSLIERQIRGDSLYPRAEKNDIKSLYIECVSICLSGRARALALLSLFSNLIPIISSICSLETLENIYAIAATNQGEQIIKRLGFTTVQASNMRQDGHTMFVVDVKKLSGKIADICKTRIGKK
jgi:hypothetical protein